MASTFAWYFVTTPLSDSKVFGSSRGHMFASGSTFTTGAMAFAMNTGSWTTVLADAAVIEAILGSSSGENPGSHIHASAIALIFI